MFSEQQNVSSVKGNEVEEVQVGCSHSWLPVSAPKQDLSYVPIFSFGM